MMNILRIGAVQHLGIFFHRMVIHGSVRSIVHIIIPFVHPHTPSHIIILPRQLGGKEELIYIPPVETGHAALYISLIRIQCSIQSFGAIAVGSYFLLHGHRSLVQIGTQSMVILHIDFPLQPVIPPVTVQNRQLISFTGRSIIQTDLFHLAGTHVHINHIRYIGQIRRSPQSETGNFLHTPIAYINKRCTGGSIGQPMAVAVMVDGRELSTSFIVELGQGKLIDLSPVLILRKTQFERTRIKILIDAAAVKPIFSDASIQIEVKLLFTEMIGAVVQHTIHFLLFIQAEFRKRIDSITYITGSNRCFGNLQQSGMSQAAVSAPMRVYIMRIRIIYHRQTIFEYIHITTGQTDRDFTRTIGTSRIQHDIAIAFLFRIRGHFGRILLCITIQASGGK